MKTVMQFWCSFRGQQGGTIHDALYDFKYKLTEKERDKFCGILVDNTSEISDLHHVKDFMEARNALTGLKIVST